MRRRARRQRAQPAAQTAATPLPPPLFPPSQLRTQEYTCKITTEGKLVLARDGIKAPSRDTFFTELAAFEPTTGYGKGFHERQGWEVRALPQLLTSNAHAFH